MLPFAFLVVLSLLAVSESAIGACSDSFFTRHFIRPQTDRHLAELGQPFRGPTGRTYFVFTAKFGEGTFQQIIDSLPALRELGFESVIISPVHPQTTDEMRGTPNDHGYWWSDPAAVAEKLGGREKFRELIEQAKKDGIEVWLDTVLDHSGYTDQVRMKYKKPDGTVVDKLLSVQDPIYFRQEFMAGDLYQRIAAAQNADELFARLDELARVQWDEGLPVFNHANLEVYEWLLHAYRGFVDLGIRHMRLDAAKHIPREFLVRFINDINGYARQTYGEEVVFLLEHYLTRYENLGVVARWFGAQTDARVLFFDFPFAMEIRRFAHDINYGFNHFEGFLQWRQEGGQPLGQLVSIVEDHDFLSPINHTFNSIMVHLLSDFLSRHPTIVYHGGEVGEGRPLARGHVEEISVDGQVGQATKQLHDMIRQMRNHTDFDQVKVHLATHDHFLIEKNIGGARLFFYVNRTADRHEIEINVEESIKHARPIEMVETPESGSADVHADGHRVSVASQGPTVVVFRF